MNPFAHFEDQFGHLQLSDNDAALHVFLAGWNSAMMEMMQRVNKMPFGDDTRASFAVYFQSQMVNVDAIEKPAQQEPVAWQYRDARDDGTWGAWLGCDKRLAEDEYRQVRALYASPQPAPVQQEPVAVVSGYYGGQCVILPIDPERIFNSNTALYTSPPAQRKPLTDEQIAKEVEAELTHYWNGEYIDTTGARDQLTAFARAIEAAHGIGEKK